MMIHRIKTDKANNDKIFHRQDLIEEMTETLEIMKVLYESNFLSMYYELLSKQLIVNRNNKKYLYDDDFIEKFATQNTEKGELSLLLKEISDIYKNNKNGHEIFKNEYQDKLVNIYNVKPVSEAEAAGRIFDVFSSSIKEMKYDMINKKRKPALTEKEKYVIRDFIEAIVVPFRDPYLRVPEGDDKCWYDRHQDVPFKKVFDASVERAIESANYFIEQFYDTEKEKNNDEMELE